MLLRNGMATLPLLLASLASGPRLALAEGDGVVACGMGKNPEAIFAALLEATVATAALLLLCWGAQAGWRAAFGRAPFGVLPAASVLGALALLGMGTYILPLFTALFESFGADLPGETRFLLDARYLLALPALLLPVLFWRAHGSRRRDRYFAGFVGAGAVLLACTLWAAYLPVIRC